MVKSLGVMITIFMAVGMIHAQTVNEAEVWEELDSEHESGDWTIEPWNLNQITHEVLSSFQLFSEEEIHQILQFIKQEGPLISITELQLIPEVDMNKLQRMAPFVYCDEEVVQGGNRWEFLTTIDFPVQDDYAKTGRFLWGRYRVNVSQQNLTTRYGIVLEKDAGESFKWSPKNQWYGFDHQGVYWAKEWRDTRLWLGDFTFQVGEGLVFGGGFRPGKSVSFFPSVKLQEIGFRHKSGASESDYLRGLAVNRSFGQLKLDLFYSRRKRDALLQEDDTFQRFQMSGYHRTTGELASRKTVLNHMLGGSISFQQKGIRARINHLSELFSHYRLPDNELRNQFHMAGNSNRISSVSLNIDKGNYLVFGEYALNDFQRDSWVVGGLFAVSPQLDFSLLYRSFSEGFQSPLANAFGIHRSAENEKGFFTSLRMTKPKKWMMGAYLDLHRFPWLKYRVSTPSSGVEMKGAFEKYVPHRGRIILEYRYREAAVNQGVGNYIYPLARKVHSWKGSYTFSPYEWLEFRTRVQYQKSTDSKGTGFLNYYEWIYSFNSTNLSLRFTAFNASQFNQSLYAHERDMLRTFSMYSFRNRGISWYVRIKQKWGKHITCWVKYRFQQTLSEDSPLVPEKNHRIKFQFRYKF